MCMMSVVLDHYYDRWSQLPSWIDPLDVPYQPPPPVVIPTLWPVEPLPSTPEPQLTPEEIAEFRRWMQRAREYDKRTGQADCELEEKRQLLLQLAEKLGVKGQISIELNNAKG